MAKESPTTSTEENTFRTLREVPEDLRADMEQMVDEGYLPSQIAEELEIPLRIVQSFKKEHKRRLEARQEAQGIVPKSESIPLTPELAEMQAKMARLRAQKQIEEMEDELEYMRRKRALDLEERELHIERKRREIDHYYGGEDQTDEPEQSADPTTPFQFGESDGEFGLVRDILRFATVLAQKNPKPAPAVVANNMKPLDPSQPLTSEQIRAEIAKYSPEQLKQAQSVPDMILKSELRKQYPSILEENINRVVHEIRHYANNSQGVHNGSETGSTVPTEQQQLVK